MADPNNLNEFVDAANVKIKRPKRVLHFSDGILEEFSDDDVDNNNVLQMMSEKKQFTDEELKNWTPWMIHKMSKTGSSVLMGCDYVGEKLAAFLGITTPKYSYEIEQYKKMKQEQKQMAKEDMESASWLANKNIVPNVQQILNANGSIGINDDRVVNSENTAVTKQTQINKY